MSAIAANDNLSKLDNNDGWRPLRLLNLYRMTLAGLFLVLSWNDMSSVVGNFDPLLFRYTALGYLLASIFYSFAILKHTLRFSRSVNLHIATDILALTLLMHASGGISTGLGTLLIVSIAGGSMLTTRRIAILYGSIASIAILSEQGYNAIYDVFETVQYTHSGILGATLLSTALIANVLSQRSLESAALAEQRSLDLANLEQLNDYIIQHMQTGIMVIDESSHVRMCNRAARKLLNLSHSSTKQPLTDICPALDEQMSLWLTNPASHTMTFRSSKTSPEIQPKFARLGGKIPNGILVFLEDTTAVAQRAQQMKLASLGRLTASIAHEIRNPLGAISHASQLLDESPDIVESDQRLTQIISDHTVRMNDIIENVMRLSRRDRAEPVLFDLKEWLDDFLTDFIRSEQINETEVSIFNSQNAIQIRMDPSQLNQVVWNLVRNGLRHSQDYDGSPKVELKAGFTRDANTPYLDVIDHGCGITPEQSQSIFEPFYTTESSGVGLGLYIARELCEGSQARLDFIPVSAAEGGGSCFRITFADPRRKQQINPVN